MTTYTFTHYAECELEGKTHDQLHKLELVDRLLSMPKYDHLEPWALEALAVDRLTRMIDGHGEPETHKPTPLKVFQPAAPVYRPVRTVRKRYPAKVWCSVNQTMIHLGVYESSEDRDTAIMEAKHRRTMGLPIK